MPSLLLITPETPALKLYREKQRNNFSQLTMPYLAGFVPEEFEIRLVDEQYEEIPRHHFDLVGITVNTPNSTHAYLLASRFRSNGSWVVLGGPHVTLLPAEAARHADTIFVGEAENTWPQFLRDHLDGGPGTVYQSDSPPDLNNLPIPRRDLLNMPETTSGSVFATRGCSYNCSYCCLKSIYHHSFRTRPLPEIMDDIASMRNSFFVFWDDNLFNDPAYAKDLFRHLAPLKKRWAAQVTIDDCRDGELLSLAGRAGCIYLFIGLESFSQESLREVNKPMNQVREYAGIIEQIHRNKISIQAGIVFGFDSDTTRTFSETMEACRKVKVDGVTPSILTPYPGTALYDKFHADNRLQPVDWTSFDSKTRVAFYPRNMTSDELLERFHRFRGEFYSMPNILGRFMSSKANKLYNLYLNLGYRKAHRYYMKKRTENLL